MIKIILSLIFILSLPFNIIFSQQINSFGLEGKVVNDIKYYNGYLFAATDSGIYRRPAGNFISDWEHIGLENKKVKVVYPHDVGPLSWTISAGIAPGFTPDDSALIYCYCDDNWTAADTGIDRSGLMSIETMDGFPSPVICGETFAGGNSKLYRREITSWYKEIFMKGYVYTLNIIKTDLATGKVWIGGETAIFNPFIAVSDNMGEDWDISYPDLSGDNACNSIEFGPDTNMVFAGMEGAVIRTTNRGITWENTSLINTPYYIYGLAYNRFLNILFAGGSTNMNEFGLYFSIDTGKTWTKIEPEKSYKGISSIVFVASAVPEMYTLYIATYGDGVLWLQPDPSDVDDKKNSPEDFILYQNYPNPFNPSTKIQYQIPFVETHIDASQPVILRVYDILGREMATLVNEEKEPGNYEIEFNPGQLSEKPASGIYFYKLQTANFTAVKKMVYMR